MVTSWPWELSRLTVSLQCCAVGNRLKCLCFFRSMLGRSPELKFDFALWETGCELWCFELELADESDEVRCESVDSIERRKIEFLWEARDA